jgi:hypothetical protein
MLIIICISPSMSISQNVVGAELDPLLYPAIEFDDGFARAERDPDSG